MFTISEDGVITMFRGDDVRLVVDLSLVDAEGNSTGERYTMQDGDTLTLTVRRQPGAGSPVLFSVTSNSEEILIVPGDTAGLDVGKYSADIQLNHGGRISTVFPLLANLTEAQRSKERPWNNFIITGEVTI